MGRAGHHPRSTDTAATGHVWRLPHHKIKTGLIRFLHLQVTLISNLDTSAVLVLVLLIPTGPVGVQRGAVWRGASDSCYPWHSAQQ